MQYVALIDNYGSNYLTHHGILGQRWGVRRFQDITGKLTEEGKKRYGQLGEEGRKRYNEGIGKLKSSLGEAASKNATVANSLDYLNRKGVLDFLDSKSSTPFSAIEEGKYDAAKALIDNYKSEAYGDVDVALKKISRYSSMVAAMRKNEPYAKIEDTSKPWMESFGNHMMGWNNIDEVENTAATRAGRKFAEAFMDKKVNMSKDQLDKVDLWLSSYNRDDLIGDRVSTRRDGITRQSSQPLTKDAHDEILKKAHVQRLTDAARLFVWDKPMAIESVDGRKVNAVIYDNGSGVRDNASPGRKERWAREAAEVRELLERTGKLPVETIDRNYRNVPNWIPDIVPYYDYNMFDWVTEHDDRYSEELYHHGTKGQKWGNRRYQNHDGSLTPLGRVHYGVGAARAGIGNAAKTAGNAIRKAVKPTDEELLEKYDKLQRKKARKDLKQDIRALKGHKKKIKDMSDQEVIDMINRYRNEHALKAMMKDANKSRTRLAIENQARDAISKSAGLAVQKIGYRMASTLDSKEDKIKRKAAMVENQAKIDGANGKKSVKDRLKEAAEREKAASDAYESNLKSRAMAGDEDAKEKLSEYRQAMSGRYKKPDDPRQDSSYVDVDEDTSQTYEAPRQNTRRNRDYEDVVREAGSDTYSAATENVDHDKVDDYISRFSRRTLPAAG